MLRILELQRIAAIRAANVAAVLGFVVYGAIAVLMVPFFLVMTAFLPSQPGQPPPWVFALFGLAYPVLGAVFGWLFTALAAAVYNLVVRWTGGFELHFAERGPAAR